MKIPLYFPYRNSKRWNMSHQQRKKLARLKSALQKLRNQLHKCKSELQEERQAALGRRWLDQNSKYVEILDAPPKNVAKGV